MVTKHNNDDDDDDIAHCCDDGADLSNVATRFVSPSLSRPLRLAATTDTAESAAASLRFRRPLPPPLVEGGRTGPLPPPSTPPKCNHLQGLTSVHVRPSLSGKQYPTNKRDKIHRSDAQRKHCVHSNLSLSLCLRLRL